MVRAARALMATPEVRSAAPSYHRSLLLQPNDPYLADQWYLQPGNSAGVALDEAWEMETGSPATVIAIIDTGVDILHPDLVGNIWNNPGEVPGNGVDDDGNGYSDDAHGWDFGQDDADPMPHYTPTVWASMWASMAPTAPASPRPPRTTTWGWPGPAGTAPSWP